MIRARWATKYLHIFQVQLLNRLAYPADLVLQSLSIIIFMIVFFQLWRATYSAAGDSQGLIAGLSLRDTLWYLLMAEVVMLSRSQAQRPISEAVKDGSVVYLLNKPYNFLVYQAGLNLGDGLSQMVSNAVIGGAVVWWMVGPPPDPRGWPLVAIALLLAWLLDFCVAALIGLAAFLTEEVSSFNWIYSKFLMILGGLLIPLDFFPPFLRDLAQRTPFAYTVYGPARLFIEPTPERFADLLQGQLLWLAVLLLVLGLVYRRAVAWLNVNGG
jgi:ABC-2 type transport system permease protein